MWNGCEIYHLKNTIHSSVKDHSAGARPSKRRGKKLGRCKEAYKIMRKLTTICSRPLHRNYYFGNSSRLSVKCMEANFRPIACIPVLVLRFMVSFNLIRCCNSNADVPGRLTFLFSHIFPFVDKGVGIRAGLSD